MASSLQAAIVMAVVTVASLPVMLRDRVAARAPARAWLGVGWMGIADAANIGLFFAAYQRTSVPVAVLTHYLTPVFVACGAPFALGERPERRVYAAVAVVLSGL